MSTMDTFTLFLDDFFADLLWERVVHLSYIKPVNGDHGPAKSLKQES